MVSRVSTFVKGFHDPAVVSQMPYRIFGATGRVVSAFSYGTSAIGGVFDGGRVDEAEAIHVVQQTIKAGVNLIDTAPWYGFGKAESLLGKALRGVPRESYYLTTKVGRYEADVLKQFDFSYERTMKGVDESLQRLGVDYIDTIQVHDPEFALSLDIITEQTIPALVELQRVGKVRSIGITGYPLGILRELADLIKVPLTSAISYSHYTLHDTSLIDSGTFDVLSAKGLGIVCASPISMGLLTKNGPPDWHPAKQSLKDRARRAAEYCSQQGTDLSRLSLAFALRNPKLHTVMGAFATLQQMNENVSLVTGKSPLTQREEEVLSTLRTDPQYFGNIGDDASWEGLEVQKYWVKVGKRLMQERLAASR